MVTRHGRKRHSLRRRVAGPDPGRAQFRVKSVTNGCWLTRLLGAVGLVGGRSGLGPPRSMVSVRVGALVKQRISGATPGMLAFVRISWVASSESMSPRAPK